MADIPCYAVVPSAGRDCLLRCLEAVCPEAETVLIRTRDYSFAAPGVNVVDCGGLNISRWWNAGIAAAARAASAAGAGRWDVLVLNDDAVIPPGLPGALSAAMRATTAVLAYPGDGSLLREEPFERLSLITGWCFLLRGESGITADERFRWWCGDNDLDVTARQMGGTLPVPGLRVTHLYPGGHDWLMRGQIPLDCAAFDAKWPRYAKAA